MGVPCVIVNSVCNALRVYVSLAHTHTRTHTHTAVCNCKQRVCVCVCVCVCLRACALTQLSETARPIRTPSLDGKHSDSEHHARVTLGCVDVDKEPAKDSLVARRDPLHAQRCDDAREMQRSGGTSEHAPSDDDVLLQRGSVLADAGRGYVGAHAPSKSTAP